MKNEVKRNPYGFLKCNILKNSHKLNKKAKDSWLKDK